MSEEWERARVIRASEIGDYVYCNRQWWLKRMHGAKSQKAQRMQSGTNYHNEHWHLVKKAANNQRMAVVLIAAALCILLLMLLVLL